MNIIKYNCIICAFTLLISCTNNKTESVTSTPNVIPNSTSDTVVNINKSEVNNSTIDKTPSTVEKDKTYIVDYQAMGAIKLDMPKNEVLKLYPNAKLSTILNEAEIPCLDVLDTDGSLLYKVGIENGKTVSVIISTHKKIKTKSGIKIGSSLSDAKKIYPDIKVSMIEGQWVAFAEKRFLSFTLSGSTNDSKVTEIWVN